MGLLALNLDFQLLAANHVPKPYAIYRLNDELLTWKLRACS
jgi:hypothetical protein